MGGALGGGGGGGVVNQQPQAGQPQIYQPQAQPGFDAAYQQMLWNLYNPAMSGLQSLAGGVSPAQTLAPLGMNIAEQQGAAGTMPGAFGPYGNLALGGALNAANMYSGLFGGPYDPLNAANQTQYAALSQLPSLAYNAVNNPQISQLVQGIVNNPYFASQLRGATGAGGTSAAAAGYAPQASQFVQNLGLSLPGVAQQLQATTTGGIPQLEALSSGLAGAAGTLPGQITGLNPQLQGLYNQTLGLNPQLAGAESSILQTGFDPRSALYNRTAQQVADQQRAALAASGVGTSPYGAGVTGQTMANFNIDWQNQQLARQAQAAGAAQGLAGQQLANLGAAGGLTQDQVANLAAAGGLQNALSQGAGALQGQIGALSGQGLNQLLSGYSGAGNLLGQGLGLGGQQMNLAATAAGLPAGVFQEQQAAGLGALGQQLNQQLAGLGGIGQIGGIGGQAAQQQLGALQSLAQMGALPAQYSNVLATQGLGALTGGLNLGQAQFQLPQTVMNDLQSYLQLGQAASQIGGGLGAIGQQSQEGMLSSIGSLGALGSSALFGSPGLGLGGGTGLLGSGTPGLLTSALGGGTPGLGGLFSGAGLLGAQGPLLGTAADASIASGGPPLALAAKAAAA